MYPLQAAQGRLLHTGQSAGATHLLEVSHEGSKGGVGVTLQLLFNIGKAQWVLGRRIITWRHSLIHGILQARIDRIEQWSGSAAVCTDHCRE